MYLFLIFISFTAQAQEKVEYKFKEYEKIDLGDFSVQGDVVTPGDLSLKNRTLKFINHDLYKRTNFQDYLSADKNLYFKE